MIADRPKMRARRTSAAPVPAVPVLRWGREVCADERLAAASEWLVANGIGGYASGSLWGQPTRGYHGLLVAALKPPVDRTLALVAVLESVAVGDAAWDLATLRWADGTLAPKGGLRLESFRLEGTTPVWTFATPRCALEKRVLMDQGANVTRIDYRVLWSDGPVTLTIQALTDFRDYHSRSAGPEGWLPAIEAEGDRLTVASSDRPEERLHLRLEGGRAEAGGAWWRGFDLPEERARGLTDREDHVHAGTLSVAIAPGGQAQLTACVAEAAAAPDPARAAQEAARQAGLLADWRGAQGAVAEGAPDWVAHLVLAADQFVAARTLHDGREGRTVIAGYHWFADWGRDTMIALPGLAIATGRPDLARAILRSFADVVDGGMIPNRFPDAGSAPEYNTVDATLWFVHAVEELHRATGDDALLAELFPVLDDIVGHMVRGTRYGIGTDPSDGLLRAGVPGVQLTWMDAKVGDWVVTPRIGKPVEVNALWLSALRFVAAAARRLGRPDAPYEALAAKAREGFERFWNGARGFCFDVIDGPGGDDPLLRPNQILAARAAAGALTPDRARRVVEVCQAQLLTPAGLRSLAPGEPGYLPSYGGDQRARDASYHMGTVWTWLIGPFLEAHLDVHGDPDRAAALLAPIADQLRIGGLGTIGEIFEAEAPHAPRGCIAQAWSVGEVLRAWHLIERRRLALPGVAGPSPR